MVTQVWTRLNAIKRSHKNPERAGWGAAMAGDGEGHVTNMCGAVWRAAGSNDR